MLTFKNHEPIIDEDKHRIGIWDDEKNEYEYHSFEFIEDLYERIKDRDLTKPYQCG